jgi:hypothetical protein
MTPLRELHYFFAETQGSPSERWIAFVPSADFSRHGERQNLRS